MEILFNTLVVIHFLGVAALLGGFLYQMSATEKTVPIGQLHGALAQLVTGLLMVGLAEGPLKDDEGPIDHAKIGTKLVILLVITALVVINKKKPTVPVGVWAAIGGLTLLNVVLAVFW